MRLKAAEVRQLLGLSQRQLVLRRSELGKDEEYEHGYPIEALESFIVQELRELTTRFVFLKSAKRQLRIVKREKRNVGR